MSRSRYIYVQMSFERNLFLVFKNLDWNMVKIALSEFLLGFAFEL